MDEQNAIWAEQEHALPLTQIVLEHYDLHRQLILCKLELVRKADQYQKKQISINNAPNFAARLKARLTPASKTQENPLWKEIIVSFENHTISEHELFIIENIIQKIPADIAEHYKELSKKDNEVKRLTASIKTEEYKDAKDRIAAIQNLKNPLTGMSAADYDSEFIEKIKALLFGA